MTDSDFEYVGNLHIHSLHSDGAGTIKEIAQSAKRAGLDFILINDHDYLIVNFHLDEEGFYDDVLVLMGLEIGGRYHHYLAYDLKEMENWESLEPQEVIDRVNAQGGFGFLAHPFEKGMRFLEKSVAYTWNDLSVEGYTGVCIWNFSSRWKERVKTALHGLYHLLFKAQTLKGPSRKTLSLWDNLCRKGRVVAIGGSDAHGSPLSFGLIRFTPLTYEHGLKSINVHILLKEALSKDFPKAKKQVYDALRQGRVFIAHEKLAAARGFRFYFNMEDGSQVTMGEEGAFQPGTLHIETPVKSEIRVLKNGILQKRLRGRKASYRVEEGGVYRVEVYHHLPLFGWRPWIFSNPIYLR